MSESQTEALLDAAFAAYEAGSLDKAEELGQRVLALAPDEALALHLLGVIAGGTERTALGIDLLRRAVALDPQSVEARSDLGQLLAKAGAPSEAVAVLEPAVRLDPGAYAAHNNLAQAYLALGRGSDAVASFERAAALAPDLAVLHYNLGTAWQSLSRNAQAAACYRRAVEIAPDLVEAHARLGAVLFDDGNRRAAIASFRRAAEAQPETPLGLASLATVLFEERREEAALDCLRRAIARDPENAEPHGRLAGLLARLGRFDESTASYERAVALDPRRTADFYGLVSGKKIGEPDRPLMARMTALLAEPWLTGRDRVNLHFALGKAHDDLGEYETAIGHFDEANRIEAQRLREIGRSLDRERQAAGTAALAETLTVDYFARRAGLGSDSELPVLIVGMPRSGTTLVEQILSSHPEVGAGDELNFWTEKAAAVANAGAGALTPAATQGMAEEYLSLLRGLAPTAHRVTDKMPLNFLHLGLVHLVFPRARIVHCRRNPLDTCLSIYFTHFGQMRDYAFERRGIVFFYEQYLRLMAHWRRVLPPDRLIEIDYEALVADRERLTRRMVEFCGLDWDDACLRSDQNRRVVRTASMWQARQPVYSTSVERWRRYEPWLGEFRKLLLSP